MSSWLRSALPALLLLAAAPAGAQSDPLSARQAGQPGGRAGDYPRLDEALAPLEREPLLMVAEGLDGLLEAGALRARLTALFGRPVVALTDVQASSALATLWVAADQHFIVLRLSVHGLDLWQRIPKQGLSGDPAGSVANAVMDMLWSDRLARAAGSEVLDPFCPPGLVCIDAARPSQRAYSLRRAPEATVLDPWAAPQQQYPLLDSRRSFPRGDPWGAPGASVEAPAGRAAPAPQPAPRADVQAPAQAAREADSWALGALAGGGLHEAGGFVRYEVNALRRFPRFDLGLAFVGARGQPDPASSVRRAVIAQGERRFVMQGLEIDLGGGFGTFVASNAGMSADVHPYLRGFALFAITLGRLNDFLVQSELGTTFTRAGDAGALEYALAAGIRQRL